jgi:peptidoglycan hydrolase CwlO-like protein
MNAKQSINTLHHQYNDWMKELDFYKNEIKILENRLTEVAVKNTSKEVLADVEHFQNKFIILNERNDETRHAVNISKTEIEKLAIEIPEQVNAKIVDEQHQLKNNVNGFVYSFADTRYELNNFLSRVM